MPYLRDGDNNWLSLEGSDIWSLFQALQRQLVAGNHVVTKNLGHQALLVPIFNLKKLGRIYSQRQEPFARIFSLALFSYIPCPTLPSPCRIWHVGLVCGQSERVKALQEVALVPSLPFLVECQS